MNSKWNSFTSFIQSSGYIIVLFERTAFDWCAKSNWNNRLRRRKWLESPVDSSHCKCPLGEISNRVRLRSCLRNRDRTHLHSNFVWTRRLRRNRRTFAFGMPAINNLRDRYKYYFSTENISTYCRVFE